MFRLFPLLLLLGSFASPLLAQQTDTLTLWLDMRTPVSEGWFNPQKEEVGVRGDRPPLNWGRTLMAEDPDGDLIYRITIPFELTSNPAEVALKIKVEGSDNPNEGWQQGRNHTFTIANEQANIDTLAWEDRPAAQPETYTGNVDIIRDFEADSLANRTLYVYLPPGYEESGSRYPVLYMHDGNALFNASAIGQEWRMDEAAEELIKSGAITPVIIVGVGNTADRIAEYTPTRQIWEHDLQRVGEPISEDSLSHLTGIFLTADSDTLRVRSSEGTLQAMIPGSEAWQPLDAQSEFIYLQPRAGITFQFQPNGNQPVRAIRAMKPPMGGHGDRYGRFLINKVKPFIDERYRTDPGPNATSLGGSSLGGLITAYLGLKHPDTFGHGLLVVSPSVWWDDKWILDYVESLNAPTDQRIWVDIGTEEGEGSVQNTRELRDALRNQGWDSAQIHYVEDEGGTHSERAWAERVPTMLKFLYGISAGK